MAEKKWGKHSFWGLGYDFDPQWVLTESQKELQTKLIEVCQKKIRPNALVCDRTYTYPRESMKALAELGLLGLIVPKSLGGLGESHICAVMVVETIARYGCPSTALVYTMHTGAVATLCFRYHNSPHIQQLLKRIDQETLIGTLSYSDPATGGHYWYPLSSKCHEVDDGYKILKYGSWATSSGCADWYSMQTVSPGAKGDYGDLSVFLVYRDEVRANTDDWTSLGMHGNQSGPLIGEGVLKKERLIGLLGEGALSNDECEDPYFLLLTASAWNGISMGAMDIAKKHVTRKSHADMGIRVCDYPTIQDYFGQSVSDTNMCRLAAYNMAYGMDKATNNNDWTLHEDVSFAPRCDFLHWLWQLKFSCAKNVDDVVDTMLHACGGTGYRTELGIERLLRDGKAAWVMGPSNEVCRQFVGKGVLLGLATLDFWEKNVNHRVLNHEVQKLSVDEKKDMVKRLQEDIKANEELNQKESGSYQDRDFDNPFNTHPPSTNEKVMKSSDGKDHEAALTPKNYKKLTLVDKVQMNKKMASFTFALPKETDHMGCLPGQYLQVRVPAQNGTPSQERYFSPVSTPTDYGKVELVLKYETQGIVSQYFKNLQPGADIEFRGPMGGFEYEPNSVSTLTLLTSGGGVTACMQLLRTIVNEQTDRTKVNMLYFSETYDEILFKEQLDKYEKTDSRVSVVHTLGESPESWEGEEGYIDMDMIQKYIPAPNGKQHKLILCGGPTMVLSVLFDLKHLGYDSSQIFVFGPFGAEQVRMTFGRNCNLASHKSSE